MCNLKCVLKMIKKSFPLIIFMELVFFKIIGCCINYVRLYQENFIEFILNLNYFWD